MAIITTDNQHYTDIANAIRSALGSSAQYKPAEMAAYILALPDNLQSKGVIIVLTDVGATATCTKNTISYSSAEQSDVHYFSCLDPGDWIVTAVSVGVTRSMAVSLADAKCVRIVNLRETWLFKENEGTSASGWSGFFYGADNTNRTSKPNIEIRKEYLSLYRSTGSNYTGTVQVWSSTMIDITPFSALKIRYKTYKPDNSAVLRFGVLSTVPTSKPSLSLFSNYSDLPTGGNTEILTASLDIIGISGLFYVSVYMDEISRLYLYDLWLE